MTTPGPPAPVTRLRAAGDGALLVDVADAGQVLGLHAALAADPPDGVTDVVPAHSSLLVVFDPGRLRPADVAAWVRRTPAVAERAAAPEVVEVPVRYDGEDLEEVGRLTGLGAAGVAEAHARCVWVVAFTGFAPGFGYLVPAADPAGPGDVAGDAHIRDAAVAALLRVPRRDSPRTRVPAGSVALAAGYSGVYPRPSPGGWRLLGRTDLVAWDAERDPPALLRPGVRVLFRADG